MPRGVNWQPIIVTLVIGFIAFLLVGGLRMAGALEFMELAAYDWFTRVAPKETDENQWITIIEVTEQDIQKTAQWPLSDETIAEALKKILVAQPRTVGLDIYRDIPVPPGSNTLSRLFVENPQLIGVMTVGDQEILPLAAIRNTDQAAFGDIVVDPGGIVRRGLLFLDDGQTVYTSFSLKLASIYLASEGIYLQSDPEDPSLVRLGEVTIRPLAENEGGYQKIDARGYQYLLDYQDADINFRSFSMSTLLSGQVPSEMLADRIVLIGVKSESVKDFFFTPLSRGLAEDQQVAGIDLQGYMTSQLLRFALADQAPLRSPAEQHKIFWLLVWGVSGSLLGFRVRSVRRFFLLIAGGLLLLACLAYGAFVARWWIPLVPPACVFVVAAGGVTAYLTGYEQRARMALMQIFSKHVSTEVANMIWDQRDQFLDGGRPRSQNMVATVFFSDLKGFTSVSEKLSPEELIDWLNTYMETMAGLIMRYGGVVDSYAGDGIKADFGVPVPRVSPAEISRDAINAVSCALAMEQAMVRLNNEWGAKGLPEVGVRVGIFTGPVVGGLLGSSQRLKYTTIGDTVNIASRLESFDKEMSVQAPCRILIGDTTHEYVSGEFATAQIGKVKLEGKKKAIMIHQVFGPHSSRLDQNSEEESHEKI